MTTPNVPQKPNTIKSVGALPTRGPGGFLLEVNLFLVDLLDVGLLDIGLLEDVAGVDLDLPILFSFQTCSPLLPGYYEMEYGENKLVL